MSGDLKFTVVQPYPEDDGAVTTPAGGGWTPGTFSFKVSVLYYDDDETDIDNFGVNRGTVAAWENISVASGDKVVIPVKIDTTRSFKFVVCFQSGATYNVSSAGNKAKDGFVTFTQSSATEYEITVISNALPPRTITFGASATTLEFSSPAYMSFSGRQMHVTDAYGNVIQKSLQNIDRSLETIDIVYSSVLSIPSSGLNTLHQWRKKQVYLKLENTSGATSPLLPVCGVIGTMSQIDTRTQNEQETLSFIVDKEGVT